MLSQRRLLAAEHVGDLVSGRPQVDLGFAVLLIIGSVVGAYLGARAMRRIPETQLKVAVVVLMVVVAFKELLFP